MKKYILSSIIYFVIFIILGCLILYLSSSMNYTCGSKEGFQKNQNIVFLGDSILKNNSYVTPGNSIDDLLSQQTNHPLYNYAEDDSTIHHVYQQLNSIPEYVNQPSTTLFLSVGGNDIINDYIKQKRDPQDSSLIKSHFKVYQNLIKTIKEKMNHSKIVLLDLYYPTHPSFQTYLPLIQEWNSLLYHESGETIVPISKWVKDPQDFVYTVEPSETGGNKIVKALVTKLSN